MSELKAFEVGLGRYCKDGSRCVVAFATGRTPRALNGKIYLKSEADKVIAEKDEKIDELEERIDELQKATDSAWSKVNAMYDELRHHKYKRCLAMARWCASRSASWCFDPADDELHKSDFYEKWKLLWRELAEKFKPSNTTA